VTPRYSIVIPSYLRHDKLAQCIQSIIAYTDLSQVEVIVVCNGASQEAERICVANRRQRIEEYEADLLKADSIRAEDRFEWESRLSSALEVLRSADTDPPISLLWYPEPLGYPRACNAGIRAAQGEYIVLLNDDCLLLTQPKNQWIDVLAKPFLEDGTVGITGPQRLWDENSEHDFLIFFCVMLRRTCLDDIGLLDESTGIGFGEDTIASIEAERKGWKVLQVPDDTHVNELATIDPNTTTLETWKHDKIHIGNFRLFHDAESTLGRMPESEEVLRRNRKMLRERYGKRGCLVNSTVKEPTGICECGAVMLDGVCTGFEGKLNCDGLYLWRAAQIDGWFGVCEMKFVASLVKNRGKILSNEPPAYP